MSIPAAAGTWWDVPGVPVENARQLRTGSALRVLDESTWRPSPAWVLALFNAGASVARYSETEGRLLVAISLPARAYAAVVLSAGVVFGRATLGDNADAPSANDDAARVRSIMPGTSVAFIKDQRRYSATFKGTAIIGGRAFLKVAIPDKQGSAEIHTFPEAEAWRIEVPTVAKPTPSSSRSQSLVRRRNFLARALGRSGFARLCRTFGLECIVIGKQSILRAEARGVRVGLPVKKSQIASARISDLLRIRQLVGEGQPFACDLVPSNTGRLPMATNSAPQSPRVVVFDGATGFLKWRHQWPSAHWVVLLDLTDARSAEAAATVKSLAATRLRSEVPSVVAAAESALVESFAFTRLDA